MLNAGRISNNVFSPGSKLFRTFSEDFQDVLIYYTHFALSQLSSKINWLLLHLKFLKTNAASRLDFPKLNASSMATRVLANQNKRTIKSVI